MRQRSKILNEELRDVINKIDDIPPGGKGGYWTELQKLNEKKSNIETEIASIPQEYKAARSRVFKLDQIMDIISNLLADKKGIPEEQRIRY